LGIIRDRLRIFRPKGWGIPPWDGDVFIFVFSTILLEIDCEYSAGAEMFLLEIGCEYPVACLPAQAGGGDAAGELCFVSAEPTPCLTKTP